MLHTLILPMGLALAATHLSMTAAQPTAPELVETRASLTVEGGTLEFITVEVKDLDRAKPAPVLFALPPGSEDLDMVEAGLGLYWRELAEKGWVIVTPAPRANDGVSASTATPASEARFSALLDLADERYNIEGGRPHLAGISNGGRGAFHLAGRMPERFLSMTCLPGMPPDAEPDFEALSSLPIALFAGAEDLPWVEASKKAAAAITARGGRISLTVVPGEGHVVSHDAAAPIFEHFAKLRETTMHNAKLRAELGAILDDLHAAASEADEARYFDHFAPTVKGPVFIGTDATERWTLLEFREFAHPYFAAGKAWSYTPVERHIELDSASPAVAWFDELLSHESYGTLRGSGVLVKSGDRWRVAQYVLSFCVPNEVASDVVERIGEAAPAKD